MLETDLAWNGLMAKTGRDNQELSVKIVDRQIAYQTDDDDDDDEHMLCIPVNFVVFGEF